MQVVAVDVGDARLEARADLRVGVLADGDEEVRPQVAAVDAARELVVELVVAGGLVEEVLLELVEDDERRRIDRRRDVLDGVLERVARERQLVVVARAAGAPRPRARRSGRRSGRRATR